MRYSGLALRLLNSFGFVFWLVGQYKLLISMVDVDAWCVVRQCEWSVWSAGPPAAGP